MPIISINRDPFPDWCEVKFAKIMSIFADETVSLHKSFPNEVLFVVKGSVLIESGSDRSRIDYGEVINLKENVTQITTEDSQGALVHLGGKWYEPCGSHGVFELSTSLHPRNTGDIAIYLRNTDFDNHFHDCDEYWIIVRGRGTVVTEGTSYDVKSGDCVITRAGQHHDFPVVREKILAVWFEGTMKGQRRQGHLYCER